MSKRLLLCRHAKSSWKNPTLPDIARPLNKRGKRDAPLMGEQLRKRGIYPDAFLASPARRARSTARKLAKKIGFPRGEIITLDTLYFGSEDEILFSLLHLPDRCGLVLLVGHNPMITDLAESLADRMLGNVPTCGIVALEFDITTWKDLGQNRGSVLFFDYPKGILPDRDEQRA